MGCGSSKNDHTTTPIVDTPAAATETVVEAKTTSDAAAKEVVDSIAPAEDNAANVTADVPQPAPVASIVQESTPEVPLVEKKPVDQAEPASNTESKDEDGALSVEWENPHANETPGENAVFVSVYNVTNVSAIGELNKVTRKLKVGGAFHAGIEVNGQEWSFGYTNEERSGVFLATPRGCEMHNYSESHYLGETKLSKIEVSKLIRRMMPEWLGTEYNLLSRNCCSFSEALAGELGVGPWPTFINYAAKKATKLIDMTSVVTGHAMKAYLSIKESAVGQAASSAANVAAAKVAEVVAEVNENESVQAAKAQADAAADAAAVKASELKNAASAKLSGFLYVP